MRLGVTIRRGIKAAFINSDANALCRVLQKVSLSYGRIHYIFAYYKQFLTYNRCWNHPLHFVFQHILCLHALNDKHLYTAGYSLYYSLFLNGYVNSLQTHELFDLI